MALDGAMKLGGAYVEITARMDKLNADLAEVKRSASGLGNVFSGANMVVAGAIGGMVASLKTASNAIRAFASQEAATQTATAVFGDSAKKVTDEANNMARAFGTVKAAYLDSANMLGMYIKNMQYTADQAADLSMGVNQLAGDLAAAWNKPFEQAAAALLSAFQGDNRAILEFGVTLSASKIEMEAMRLGFTKLNGELSSTAKMYSALSIIMRESKDAQGAMVREVDQLGSQLKRAGGSIVNMSAELGGSLAPALQGFFKMMTDLGQRFSWIWTGMLEGIKSASSAVGSALSGVGPVVSAFLDSFADVNQKIQDFAGAAGGWVNSAINSIGELSASMTGFGFTAEGIWKGIGDAIAWVGDTLKWLYEGGGLIFRNFGDVLEMVTLKFWEFGTNVVEVVATIPNNLSRIGTWIANNWRELIADGLNAVWTMFQNLSTNVGEFANALWQFLSDPLSGWDPNFKPLLDGFEATVQQMPELIKPVLSSMDEEFAKIGQRINDREAGYAAGIKAPAPIKVAEVPMDLKAAKEADAAMKRMMGGVRHVEVTEGASNFAKKIQESLMNGGAQQVQEKQLDALNAVAMNTGKMVDRLDEDRGDAGAAVLA